MSSTELPSSQKVAPAASSQVSSVDRRIWFRRWIGIFIIAIGFLLFILYNSSAGKYFSNFWHQENFVYHKSVSSSPIDSLQKVDETSKSNSAQNLQHQESDRSFKDQLTDQSTNQKLSLLQDTSKLRTPAEITSHSATPIDTSTNSVSSDVDKPLSSLAEGENSSSLLSESGSSVDSLASSDSDATTMSRTPEANHIELSALRHKIETLERDIQKEAHQKAQLWSRLQQLQIALKQFKNFEFELQQFRALWPLQAKIWDDFHFLESYAKTEMPSFEKLLNTFPSVKQEVIQIFGQHETGWRRWRLKLMPWIQIYKTKNVDSTSASFYLLAKLEKAVIAQDFDQIVQILKPLRTENYPILNRWRQQVQDYDRLKQIQVNLTNQTIAEIVHPQSTL